MLKFYVAKIISTIKHLIKPSFLLVSCSLILFLVNITILIFNYLFLIIIALSIFSWEWVVVYLYIYLSFFGFWWVLLFYEVVRVDKSKCHIHSWGAHNEIIHSVGDWERKANNAFHYCTPEIARTNNLYRKCWRGTTKVTVKYCEPKYFQLRSVKYAGITVYIDFLFIFLLMLTVIFTHARS